MKHNKSQFIFDNFIETQGTQLDVATGLLNAAGVCYCVEPWGDGLNRVYVRKDVAHVLKIIEKGVKEDDPGTNGARVSESD